ncbi:hypothetical protein KL921_001415 [Ogataea angusta]|uniref:Pheromone alpha factor receptor n=1 Tax=Pichia angusta TaxID=870730 RepID=A0AAN6DGM9_PICAN|nr:uncharacterized protein KL928_002652 [Ogataea angusta]KAG7812183.1 hypothetical protein KL921_001415 [Ogataea angusta]KAG7818784.1 hypothetical protein KL928_002652 [Ogataea angusta]KAG7825030.1 hypothetical protein KL909_001322 [Ogataea angusta]KAG7830217.1 hypothetical protein KL920_001855 [Ogataea angusta]KAG7834651.1 hypothetical protein KL943_003035 [Ogataea angusta]
MSYSLPPGLDPNQIALNYTSAYGFTEVTFAQLDSYVKANAEVAAIFGMRIGLAAIAVPAIYFVTRNKKSVLFVLNEVCMATMLIHGIMTVCTMFEAYRSLAFNFSGYLYVDKHASDLSAATNVIYVILIGLTEASLTYQVHIVFRGPSFHYRNVGFGMVAVCGLLGLASTVLYFIYAVMSNIALYDINSSVPMWVMNASQICYASSSFIISIILSCKLFVAIRTRKFLGLRQFSIFHVLFIMALQTMIIPTILVLVSFREVKGSSGPDKALNAVGTALIAISLPLTTMWANSAVDETSSSSASNTYLQKVESYSSYGSGDSGSPKSYKSGTSISEEVKDIDSHYSTSPNTAVTDKNFWSEVQYLAQGLKPADLDDDEFVRATVETSINRK